MAKALPSVGGDGGLAEACRLFWLLNTLTLSVTASGSFGGGGGSYSVSTSAVRPTLPNPVGRVALTNGLLLEGADAGYAEDFPYGLASAQTTGAYISFHEGQWYLVASLFTSVTALAMEGYVSTSLGWSLGTPPANSYVTGETVYGVDYWERTDVSSTHVAAAPLSICGHSYPAYTSTITYILYTSGGTYSAPTPTHSVTPTSSHTFHTV